MKAMLKIQSLYTILARLSKREKTVLYAAVFFISLTLLDRLIVYPIFSKIEGLNKEIQAREAGIKKNLHILAHRDRILAESVKYSALLSSARSEKEEMTFLLKEIESLANESSVYLIDMKDAGLKNLGSSKKYFITLNCEAQVEQLTDFMYNIESSNRLLSIEKYQISPKSKDSSVARCSMSISKLAVP